MGEIDDVEDAPDHRETQADQGQEEALEQTVDGVLQEIHRPLLLVLGRRAADGRPALQEPACRGYGRIRRTS
ncbi:MAG: hypothetical protein NVS1B3_06530 [Candidatus Dormibacteraceae bacterium]